MSNELFTADLEVRLRSAEANLLLRRFRAARKASGAATIAMLDRDVMKQYGQNLVVIEPAENGEFAFLYAGSQVPDDAGATLGAKTTTVISREAGELYRLGCREAGLAGDAVCVNHQSGPESKVHRWECLFLPITDAEGRPILVALCIPREYKHEFFRAVLDAMPHGAFVAEPVRDAHNEIVDARIIAANARGIEICGHPDLDALQGCSITGAMGDGAPLGPWDRHLAVLRSGKGQSFDHHHRSETGSHWYQMHAAPMRDGLLVSVVDITEIKQGFLELEHQRKMLLDEMEQRRGLEQELWALAHHDPLTSLPNRRAFRDAAMLKLAEAQTTHRPCAMITIDIDHFKRVNDAFGHGAGDTVLRRVADIIKAPLRPNTDIAARMGGEEFTILLPDTDSEAAIVFAEKLRLTVEQSVVVTAEQEIRCTISIGIALNRKTSNLDDLINRADRALYTAKRSGRNKVATELDVQAGPKSSIAAA
ncbi:MAG: diguanylate cyclase [Beijerinckiaceae bacterium]|nr:diguanylate cyclase [Beijerinckiaceae bacterium]